MKLTTSLGKLLLAIWLLLYGLVAIASLSFAGLHFVLGGLAIAAAVCLALDR
jgi:hypothetical protein